MITNNNSWSLGSRHKTARLNPNKSLDQLEPSIPTHPSDPTRRPSLKAGIFFAKKWFHPSLGRDAFHST
jgi:hypothetical protein